METEAIQTRLDESLKESVTFFEIIKEHKITDSKEYEDVSELLKVTKSKIKLLDQERTLTVKPMNDQVREINAWYKRPLDKLKEIESQLKGMLANYQVRQREEQERLLKEAASEQVDHIDAQILIMEAAQQAVPAVSGVSLREVWKWDLEDSLKVPIEYYSIDPAKIEAAVKAGVREIPGVRIYKDTRIAVRG